MWERLTWSDVRIIAHYLGVLLSFMSAGFAIPFVVALLCEEWESAAHYLLVAGIALIVGTLLRFLHIRPGKISHHQALFVTGLSWIVLGLMAAVPLYMSGHYLSPTDAVFDAVSGLTTTGASVIVDLDHLSNADNMWRFLMHGIGGLGLIVVGVTFGLFGRGGGASLYSSEGRSEHIVPNVMQTARFIFRIAAVVILIATFLLFVLCALQGMEPSRAFLHSLWLSMSAFMTGGFAPVQQSVLYYRSAAVEFIIMIVMFFGSINFVLHSSILRGKVRDFFRDTETITTFLWLSVLIVVLAATISGAQYFSGLPAMLRHDLFMVISAYSTTGFANINETQLTSSYTSGALITLAILMGVGGGSGSTAGGIKLNRVGFIFKTIFAALRQSLAPESARIVIPYYHMGDRILDSATVRSAMTVTSLYTITYIVGALMGIAAGYDATKSIFESVAMASNAGITSGIIVPGMSAPLELFYIFEMWAGRLEFVTLFALIVKVATTLFPVMVARHGHNIR